MGSLLEQYSESILSTLIRGRGSLDIATRREFDSITFLIVEILFAVAAFIFPLVLLRRSKRKVNENGKNQIVKTVEDIPSHYHYKFKVPTIVEGLTTIYQFQRDGARVLEDYANLYSAFPLFEIAAVNSRIYVLNDAAMVQKILGSSDVRVLNKSRRLYNFVFVEWLRDGLVNADVETWQPHKKMIAPAFSYKALPRYLPFMNRHGKALVSNLSSMCSDNTVQGEELYDSIYSYLLKITSEVLFSANSLSVNDSDDFLKYFKGLKKFVVRRLFNPLNAIPLFWWLNPNRPEYDRYRAELVKFIMNDIDTCKKEIELHRKKTEEDKLAGVSVVEDEDVGIGGKPFRSVIEAMVQCNASEKEIYDEVGTLLSAGHETTVGTVNFFLQHIAEHPEHQKKCQQEIDEQFASKSQDDGITMDDLSNLKYLERCIMETLRLTPTASILTRELSAPMQIDEFKFDKGTIFCACTTITQKDPRLYPDPLRFDPDRFLPENMKERPVSSFIAFSLGPRNCIGMKMAMMEMKVVLAWILRHFDLHTEDRLKDIKIIFDFSLVPERNFKISFKKRMHIPSPSP